MTTESNWQERNRQFHAGFTHCATNQHSSSSSRRLFGGTACYMTHPIAHRSAEHGQDPTGLGRWTWTLLKGRNQLTVRIISVYRPTRSIDDNALTVYAQHELYFRQHGGWRDPRIAIFEDLDTCMQLWLDGGDQIILGMDANEDIRQPAMAAWRIKWKLSDPLTELHGPPNVSTCNSNHRQIPIDIIWCSPGLDILDGGMTGFDTFDLGTADHRLLWLDIDKESMFGFRPPPPKKRPGTSIPLHDPLVIRRYNKFQIRQHKVHGFGNKIFGLEQRARDGVFSREDAANYDKLLLLDLSIKNRAKKQCRRFYSGQVLYSDAIAKTRKEIHLWNMVISRRQGIRTDTRAIRRLMRFTGATHALRQSLEAAIMCKTDCCKRYALEKKNQIELRESFQTKVCARRAAQYNTSVAAQEKIVRNNKLQGGAYQKINRILGTRTRHPITVVEYTDPTWQQDPQHPQAPRIQCHTKEDIESAVIEEGKRRYTQTAGTPPMTGSLLRDLGYLATQATVDSILMGRYTYDDDLDQYTREFLDQLFIPDSILSAPIINGVLSTKEHVYGWSRMKKTVASSPFGPVFSDYIAGSKDLRVADIDAAISAIPTLTGYSPTAWHKALDVMIQKKQSSAHVLKLRIIVLFHSLFNMINKNVGRLAVKRADEHNLIPPEAYGSRPGRRANICALNKVLSYDIIRQRRRPSALCSNDAVSCYDRIVHSIASICMQRVGVDASTCRLMFGTLQDISHYVTTAFGVGDEPYGGIEIPLQGVGQGNGAGPAIWLIMSIPLINMLKTKGYGFSSTTVLTGEGYRFVCFTFVDDTDVIHTPSNPSATHLDVVREMQEVINTWEGGLRSTGGALSSGKSYWYLINFDWNHSRQRWDYIPIARSPGSLTIKADSNIERSILTRHEVNHAEETLGLWIAPDMNQDRQILALQAKISKWGDKIRSGQLSTSLAWLSLSSGISMALKYPLTATNLSRTDCKLIMGPFLDVVLPAQGLRRTMPHAIVFAPKKFLGYGIFDLWLHQGVDQIQACLDYGHRDSGDITGHQLRDIMETLRLELGLPGQPLSYNFHLHSLCATKTKMNTIWEFCWEHNFVLKDGLADLLPRRINDEFLMSVFTQHGYTARQLAMLNRCRLYLQVITISDLVTGDGTSLHPGTLDCRTSRHTRRAYTWPIPGTPNAQCWRFWRDALIRCLLHHQTGSIHLRRPLGPWYSDLDFCEWHYCPASDTLYQTDTAGGFLPCHTHRSGHRTRRPTFLRPTSSTVSLSCLPTSAVPTTVYGRGNTLQHTGTSTWLKRSPSDSVNTLQSFVHCAPDSFGHILDGIRSGTAVAVTDGSFKDAFGTAAFTILSDINSSDPFTLTNVTPGSGEDIDAYRAELGGIYGIVDTVNLLCAKNDITEGFVTLGCDCESALRNLATDSYPSPTRPHHDLLLATRYLMAQSPVQWSCQHIRGHQDDHRAYEHLDPWEKLNVQMDGLAKSTWTILRQNPPPPFHLPAPPGHWSIWSGSKRLPNWTMEVAQDIYHGARVTAYWDRRLACPNAMQQYDWSAAALALRRLPTYQRLWVPKWFCSALPTGNNLVRWKHPELANCPRCGLPETHRFHVVRCPHIGAFNLRTKHRATIDSFMTTSATEPDIRLGILSLLDSALDDSPWTPPATSSDLVRPAFLSQLALGNRGLLDGFLSHGWATAQELHYLSIGRRTTGKQWSGRLIRLIWQMSWDLWMHRRRIKDTIDDMHLPTLHITLDDAIDAAYTAYHLSPTPSLTRWFSRPSHALHLESLDWKTRWLEMVTTVSTPP